MSGAQDTKGGQKEGIVDSPSRGPMQGLRCYPPTPDDWPDYRCRTEVEGLVITNLESARRFFRKKCRWSAKAVEHITQVVFLEQQTWQDQQAHGKAHARRS
jgi:hypothetical protein